MTKEDTQMLTILNMRLSSSRLIVYESSYRSFSMLIKTEYHNGEDVATELKTAQRYRILR